jgi:type I restriction enzyme S subunit
MFPNLPISWLTKKIGELCDVSRGSSPRPIHDQRYFEGGTIPWIKIADATKSGKYLYKTKQYVNNYGASFSRLLPPGTILVAASGTLGYTQILGVEGCAHDGWLILQHLHDVDRDYLYYALQWMNQHFYNSAYGAAIQNINTMILQDTDIPYPPLRIQRNIGAILSAYDDMIENNFHRIKILEEMAQTIYEEWFVYFRFPGHENIRLVDSGTEMSEIPVGWALKKIGDVLELAYGKGLKADHRIEGSYPVFGSAGIIGYHNEMLVKGPGIIVGRKGNVGSVFWSNDDFYPIDTVFYVVTDICLHYVFFNLQTQNFINNDAAVPGLNRNQAYLLPFLLPERSILDKFRLIIEPIFQLTRNLTLKNASLIESRDLLLPKLISGELDVSEVGIHNKGIL